MACHEIAALRLGLMEVLGAADEAERQHELAELGDGADAPGPIRSLCAARDLATLKRSYQAAVAALEERVSATAPDDRGLPYLRTLVVLTRKVELELGHQIDGLVHLSRDLEEMHDFVHEIYPGDLTAMATIKTAQLTETATLGPETRFLALATDEPLGFVGGQYVIIDSGEILPSGKACKRAYSILSSDEEQHRFELAVMRIPDGPGSRFVHGLEDGRAISFSGPWGKFFPAAATDGPTLVIATDTGITAALGLVRSTRFRPLLGQTVLVWLRVASDYFLPEAFVRDRIPAGCGEVRIEALPAIGHPDRVPHARAVLQPLTAGLAQAFIAGDGAVNYALLDDLVAAGVPATRDHVDSFFNMPKKSA